MASSVFTIERTAFDELSKHMEEYGIGAGLIIEDFLKNEGATLIMENILGLLPQSNRRWRGKAPAASSTMPFEVRPKESDILSVTVGTKYKYHYLYFPDDGSNTRHHAGEQHFMERGAEAASDEIIKRCIDALIKDF